MMLPDSLTWPCFFSSKVFRFQNVSWRTACAITEMWRTLRVVCARCTDSDVDPGIHDLRVTSTVARHKTILDRVTTCHSPDRVAPGVTGLFRYVNLFRSDNSIFFLQLITKIMIWLFTSLNIAMRLNSVYWLRDKFSMRYRFGRFIQKCFNCICPFHFGKFTVCVRKASLSLVISRFSYIYSQT